VATKVRTDWVRIGRSGDTVDGREIEAQWLTEAAENYDKNYFSAPIWPGHQTWYRLGTVEDLKAEANDEGGVDLFAVLSPNEYYIQANKSGQRLHTSMELRPNFQNKGTWYLKGLAATDEPASVATSEIQFSEEDNKDSIFTDFTENTPKTFAEDKAPRWFQRLFPEKFTQQTDEDAMSQQSLEELKTQLATVTQELAEIKKTAKKEEPPKDDFSTLNDTVVALSEKVQAIADTLAADKGADAGADDKYADLESKVVDLTDKLTAALKEQNGTNAGEHQGENLESDECL